MVTPSLSSSSSSSRTPPTTGGSGVGDSCYYPGCRKDTNCGCQICLASIDATRDLVSSSSLVSSRRSAAPRRPPNRQVGPLFGPKTPPSSPPSASASVITAPVTPPARSTAKSRPMSFDEDGGAETPEKASSLHRKHRFPAICVLVGWALLGMFVAALMATAMRAFGPKLEPETVARLGEESRLVANDFKGRLPALQQRIGRAIAIAGAGKVSPCDSDESIWELNQSSQDFFHWKCVLYKSAAEEISIWGSHLRTSGLFRSTLSSRSLTLISGQIKEWSNGKMTPTLRASNGSSSWTCRKWSVTAVQLDAGTWVLEYKRNPAFDRPEGVTAAIREILSLAKSIATKITIWPWKVIITLQEINELKSHPT